MAADDLKAGGHIIAIVGGKGGVGKSVFAANFALAMAADTKNGPCLIDMDPQGTGDLNLILGVKQIKGFGEELLEGKLRDSAALKNYMSQTATGIPGAPLYSLQLMSNPERILAQDAEKVELAMKLVKKTFPVTIVDCGSRIEGPLVNVLALSTLILVVTNPDILVLNQTKKIIEKLQKELFPVEMTKVVLNRFVAGGPYQPQFIEQSLKRQVLAVVPEDAASATAALAKGLPMILSAPQSGATKACFGLSRLLVERKVLEQLATLQKPKPKAALAIVPEAAPSSSGGGSAKTAAAKPVDTSGRSRFGKEPTDPRSIFKLRVQAQLVEKMDLKKEQLDRALSAEKKLEMRDRALKIVTDILQGEDHPWKTREESAQLIKEILDEALALGPLEDLLADDSVTEVMVNRADLIYIERGGKNMKSKTTFSSNQQLLAIIERIVNPIGRRIDEKSPYVDARLADGSRVHAIIPPLSLDGPMVTIRKFPKKGLTPDDLVRFKSMSQEMCDFIRACVEAKMNIIVSGGTGSGKTTLLNCCSTFIKASDRVLTVEDAAELRLNQEHVGRLETRPPNIEGEGAVTIRDLVKQTLRMKPDRIIIGEVRGGEALDMLQAMNTGHDGSMATVHANTPRDALKRIETLVMMAGLDMPVRAIREQIAGAVNLIMQQTRLSDGSKKVTAISEITGMEGDKITTQDIFVFQSQGFEVDKDGRRRVVGKHVATGLMPSTLAREKMDAVGIKLPPGIFKAA